MEVTLTNINQYFTRIAPCLTRPNCLQSFFPGVLLLFFFNQPAFAAVIGKVVQPFASYAFTADDNILRIRDKMDPVPLLNTNNLFDMSHRFTGGLLFEKEISRQRLTANLNWAHTSFEKFNQMDNNLKNLNGNWNWFLGNRLEGNMGASYVQSLAPFLFQPGIKNIRTEQRAFINAIWRFHPSWNLHGDYTRYDLSTDSPIERLKFLNRIEDRFEGGIDYVTSDRNTVGILFRDKIGDFPARVLAPDGSSFTDNGYDQKEVMARINWVVSAKSRLLWTGGWVERKNASFSQRDFSGFNARMTYAWEPTSKVGLTINAWRETAAMQQLTASFSLNTGVSVEPSWNITQKVTLEGNFSYETREFSRFAVLTDPLPLGRNNTIRNAAVKLTYTPYLGLQLSASVYNNHLKSDVSLGGFSANGANINLQYTYGKR
ncbi:XrtB/PEP-CTERM-associated polysaccharide biosynthesis outer membrane protein EpsL [Nitrosomonas sp.]|uniref:XrtB/PEP-CTERM-associated polysaccharide biosynthesis outer membrane protein EpsL n=1 Tax=Nitrosomonas sp. TaxID=42353 RepID=UPI00374D9C4E